MPDFILVTGDIAMFLPAFGPAMVVVRPGILQGSGPVNVNGRKVYMLGDEKNVMVPGCPYVTPICSIPGTGMEHIGVT